MTTIITINPNDSISDSRSDLNTNFSNLNSDKIETSALDTDTALTANSDAKLATQKAVKAYVDSLGGLSGLVPTGSIISYGGSSAPANFLLCDGTEVSRATYATLFSIIGTSYGVGDGSNTFNLPDLRNRTAIGAGTGTKVTTFASRASNVITVTGLSDAANNEFQTGQAVVYHTDGTVITGLSNDTTYYIVRTGNLTFSLATSLANAQKGTVITLSGDGTGTQTFTKTFTARTLGHSGGEENHAMTTTELVSHKHPYFPENGSGGTPNGLVSGGAGGAAASVNTFSDNFGGNVAMNVLNPFAVVNYIIKY